MYICNQNSSNHGVLLFIGNRLQGTASGKQSPRESGALFGSNKKEIGMSVLPFHIPQYHNPAAYPVREQHQGIPLRGKTDKEPDQYQEKCRKSPRKSSGLRQFKLSCINQQLPFGSVQIPYRLCISYGFRDFRITVYPVRTFITDNLGIFLRDFTVKSGNEQRAYGKNGNQQMKRFPLPAKEQPQRNSFMHLPAPSLWLPENRQIPQKQAVPDDPP